MYGIYGKMRKTFRKLFNLFPGEGRKASLFLILGFLWSLGAFGGLTLSEGLFLEHAGASQLPASYLVTALGMCLLSTLLLFALNRLSISHLLVTIILVAAICSGLLCFLNNSLGEAPLWYWFLFKSIGWCVPIAIYICFWAFIDQYYDLQDAKRCFCLFNSVLYLGDAVAGGLISFTLEVIGVNGLMMVFIASFFSTIPLIYFISRKTKQVPEESYDGNPQASGMLSSILKLILKSPFTLILLAFYFLMQVIVITTEYSYMDSFEKSFSTLGKAHVLTEFLGMMAMWVSLGNMLFGLFFYSRTVTKFGVNNIILVAPLFFFTIFGFWAQKEAFTVALLAFIAREGMIYTFDDNNLLLLISGVPTKIKNQVRVAIESFFEPIGMLVGASLLFFLHDNAKILGVAICFLACLLALLLRSHYAKAIIKNLVDHALHFEKKAIDWFREFKAKEKKKIELDLLSYLKTADEQGKILALEYLLKMENPSLLPKLLNQFERLSVRGKTRVIDLLSDSHHAKETIVIERLHQWRKTLPNPSIRSHIHFYLAKHHLMKREMVMQDLESQHLALQGAAILSIKTSHETLSKSFLALEKLKNFLESDSEEKICMGLVILGMEKKKENIQDIASHLKNRSLLVKRQAAKAIFMCATHESFEFAPLLLNHISHQSDPEVRMFCLKALEKISDSSLLFPLIEVGANLRVIEKKLVETICVGFGEKIAPEVIALMQDEALSFRMRLLAAKILSKLSLHDLKASQGHLVKKEIERAYFYLYHATTVNKNKDLDILENALQTTFKATLDFIIQILAMAGAEVNSEVMLHTLKSKNRKIRGAAFEMLEKATDPVLFQLLKPLLDERRQEEALRVYMKKTVVALTLSELLETLESSPSVANQIVSLTLKAKLKLPNWKESLKTRLEGEEKLFHNFAHELLTS